MHAGWALFCAIALGVGRAPRARVALLAYPALITAVVIGSGNHFVLDAIAGFAVVGLGFASVAMARWLWSRTGLGGTRRVAAPADALDLDPEPQVSVLTEELRTPSGR
jgi:hypothetical protein